MQQPTDSQHGRGGSTQQRIGFRVPSAETGAAMAVPVTTINQPPRWRPRWLGATICRQPVSRTGGRTQRPNQAVARGSSIEGSVAGTKPVATSNGGSPREAPQVELAIKRADLRLPEAHRHQRPHERVHVEDREGPAVGEPGDGRAPCTRRVGQLFQHGVQFHRELFPAGWVAPAVVVFPWCLWHRCGSARNPTVFASSDCRPNG